MDTFEVEAVDYRVGKKERYYLVRRTPGGRKVIIGEIYSQQHRDTIVGLCTAAAAMPALASGAIKAARNAA